jgi:hypothetical protein
MSIDMTNSPLSMDYQKLTRKDLITAEWVEIIDATTGRSWWKHPSVPGEYGFEGAKYYQSVLQRRQ